jgi:DNA helicase-2/ATP-dependent DNA helicase PcrA
MDKEDDRSDKVKLMTIHTSKGLEFPYVFLCGFTEGVLPSAMSIKERRAKAIEEERRLTYVAITRAEKAFYMTESEGFNFSTGLNKYPSRFLFEISDNYFVRKGELSQEIIDEAKEQLKLDSTRQSIQKKFNVDDIVNHRIWNQGKIIEVNEEKGEYQIEFLETGKTKPINFGFRGLVKEEGFKSSANKIKKETEKEEVETNLVEKPNVIEEVKSEEKEPEIEKKIKAKIKRFAKKEYPEDKEMRDHIYKNQVKAFLHMETVSDIELKEYAISEYNNDYDMQQHIYDKNVIAKKYMNSVMDTEIKEIAKQDFPKDYDMQQHIYDKQVSAKKEMSEIPSSSTKESAINDYPKDYDMQIYAYEKLKEEKTTDNIEVELVKTKTDVEQQKEIIRSRISYLKKEKKELEQNTNKTDSKTNQKIALEKKNKEETKDNIEVEILKTETDLEQQKELIRNRITAIKDEKKELELSTKMNKTVSEINKKIDTKDEAKDEEEILSPTMAIVNTGIWSKIKGLFK